MVLSVHMNAPYTLTVPLMLKLALAALLSTEPPATEPGVHVGRFEFEYAVTSDQVAWLAIVSPDAGVPVPFRPTYQAGLVSPDLKAASRTLLMPTVVTRFLKLSFHLSFGLARRMMGMLASRPGSQDGRR